MGAIVVTMAMALLADTTMARRIMVRDAMGMGKNTRAAMMGMAVKDTMVVSVAMDMGRNTTAVRDNMVDMERGMAVVSHNTVDMDRVTLTMVAAMDKGMAVVSNSMDMAGATVEAAMDTNGTIDCDEL